jgi:hypothetical protein
VKGYDCRRGRSYQMPEVEERVRPLQRNCAVVTAIFCAALIFAVFIAVEASSSTTARPQVITGKFMGLSIDGGSLTFQPEGKTTGTSYAYSSDTVWISATGVVHTSGPTAASKRSTRGAR